eukprot:TRINITY_DN891_c0_g1_i3.p1 TRINITY_DN891_c0_g1~~TRINITY_DN891_c0_g1_i3.p1  ORF type:complete len:357 (+),score=38.74 TRINITY_DN891_c0_g1_i3:74-1144(+)
MGFSDGPSMKISARLHTETTGGEGSEFDDHAPCFRSFQVPCLQVADVSAVQTSKLDGWFTTDQCTSIGESVGPSSISTCSDDTSNNRSPSELLSDSEDLNGLQAGVVAVVDLSMCASLANMKEFHREKKLANMNEFKTQFSLASSSTRSATTVATESDAEVPVEWQGKTSIILRNLAPSCTETQVEFAVRQSGFAGTYDYFYMPVRATTGASKGYAFFNFEADHTAYRFKCVFEGNNLGLARPKEKLNVRPSNLQGYEQNVKHLEGATSLRASEGREPKQSQSPAAPSYSMRVMMSDSPAAMQQNFSKKDASHAESVHKTTYKSPTDNQRKFCHSCGQSVSPSFRFCQYCGASLLV